MRLRWLKTMAIPAMLLVAAMAGAQTTPTVTAQPNTIYVSAEGRYEAAPDTAVLQFNISPQEDTAQAAYAHASRAAEQVRQLLRDNGLSPSDAEIGFFSLSPVYNWKQPQRKLVGYRVTSSVTLKLKDFRKVGPIVERLANIDVTANQSLNYTLDKIDAAKLKAVNDAFVRARGEAEAVAKAGGRNLGQLYYGSVDANEEVRMAVPMAMKARVNMEADGAPAPTAEFAPQNIVVTARVTAMFSMN